MKKTTRIIAITPAAVTNSCGGSGCSYVRVLPFGIVKTTKKAA